MNDVIDLREPGVSFGLGEALDDAELCLQLEAAYAARLDAVLHGSDAQRGAATQRADDLERIWLERRRVRGGLRTALSRDPSYYLG